MLTTGTDKEVINWKDALEQCGGDEEFLRELLTDFKSEIEENVRVIREALDAHADVIHIAHTHNIIRIVIV